MSRTKFRAKRSRHGFFLVARRKPLGANDDNSAVTHADSENKRDIELTPGV